MLAIPLAGCIVYLLTSAGAQFQKYSYNADFDVNTDRNGFDPYIARPLQVDQRLRIFGVNPNGRNFDGAKNGWLLWTEWSFCSRPCGGGVAMRTRRCKSRYLRNTKKDCTGRDTQHKICNVEPCFGEEPEDFRASQCFQFNNRPVFGSLKFRWIPYYGNEVEVCTLSCMAEGYNFYKNFGPVQDGTRCSRHHHDICVDGQCLKVGCDEILGSNLTEDTCGRCGGDNSTCLHYSNVYNQLDTNSAMPFEYHEVAFIPAGATHIKIKEGTSNYLALMENNGQSATYVLNGNRMISWPGDFMVAGTVILYDRIAKEEMLTAAGPTTMDLHIMLLYLGDNVKVEYEYWIPMSQQSDELDEFDIGQDISLANYYENFYQDLKAVKPVRDLTTTTTAATTTTITTTTALPTTTTTVAATTTHRLKKTSKLRNRRPAHCSPCKKLHSRKKHFCQSDFVIHARISSKKKVEKRRYKHDITILSVYKSALKLMKREYLWIYSDCCPKLRPFRQYLLMGRKRNVEIGASGRGEWKSSKNETVVQGARKKRYETRLVVDYMDYWHIWRQRYERGLNRMANKPKCRSSDITRPPLSLRDPERKPKTRRNHKRNRH